LTLEPPPPPAMGELKTAVDPVGVPAGLGLTGSAAHTGARWPRASASAIVGLRKPQVGASLTTPKGRTVLFIISPYLNGAPKERLVTRL
ncbi:MAG: hypothetical protein CFE44_10440, partial [Burkholderiales bacterium PBB4]